MKITPLLQLGITVTTSLCMTAVHCCQSMNFSNGPPHTQESWYSNWLWTGLSGFGDLIPSEGWEIFSLPPHPDCSKAHPAFYPVGSRGSFPGGKVIRAQN